MSYKVRTQTTVATMFELDCNSFRSLTIRKILKW